MDTNMEEYVYFELNNWIDYPNTEPFVSWMCPENDNSWILYPNELDKYCKDNELIMVVTNIDLSANFCVTARRNWVEDNCPDLLTEYTEFLRKKDNNSDMPVGYFGSPFLKYTNDNIGVHYYELDTNGEYIKMESVFSNL